MGLTLMDFAERLVPISEFSQGKAGKIFNDVFQNNREYIVLKNNQPTAVVLSIKEYQETQKKLEQLENLLENIENHRLLELAEKRKNSKTVDYKKFLKEEGINVDDLLAVADNVELE